jgi:predicted acetylornithine/succinylornithine family transaminase
MNIIAQSDQYLAQTYKRPPFVLTHGQGSTLYDESGQAYLDLVAGIAVMSLGHSDPQIAATIAEQAQKLTHVSNLYYTEPQTRLAAALCEASFAERVFFCNSGAEANEGALKFARKLAYAAGETDRYELIAFDHAFHGRTMGALSVTPKPAYQDPFRPLVGGAKILPMNDLPAAAAAIGPQTCAVIVEPIQGEGGVHPAQADFLRGLRHLCDQHGAALIFDEVQCGLGRTGTLWAHEFYGVVPDMMTLAKPLAAGLPIGAVLMNGRVHTALAAGDHGSTFAGGPLVCAVAAQVLERIGQPDFLAAVAHKGQLLAEGLSDLASPHILDIRGRGLMLGVELDFPAGELIGAGYEAGLLMVNAGPNTLRLIPPLVITEAEIHRAVAAIGQLLAARP